MEYNACSAVENNNKSSQLKTTINLAMIFSPQKNKQKSLTEMIITNVLLIAFIQHFSLFGCRLTNLLFFLNLSFNNNLFSACWVIFSESPTWRNESVCKQLLPLYCTLLTTRNILCEINNCVDMVACRSLHDEFDALALLGCIYKEDSVHVPKYCP